MLTYSHYVSIFFCAAVHFPRQADRRILESGSTRVGVMNGKEEMIADGRKTYVMGILNVTPDSFSDGGRFVSDRQIVTQVETMIDQGADIIDVGGESTRPFAKAVSEKEEMQRVLPAIRLIREISEIPVSIDTTKAEVARRALDAGADMVNDISALTHDPAMPEVVRSYSGPVIIMHMQGTPRTMQLDPRYDDVVGDICSYFRKRINQLEMEGIEKKRIVLDPGIGFGKTVSHNLAILQRIGELQALGCPVLVGHSRKMFLGKVLDLEVEERDTATAVVSGWCASKGVAYVRVHNVGASVQAVRITRAIMSAGP